jgi:hypothetical protein
MYKKPSIRNTIENFLLAPAISNPKYAPDLLLKNQIITLTESSRENQQTDSSVLMRKIQKF